MTEERLQLDLEIYEDDNEWVLPSLPSPASVPDNTSCFGPLYFWRGESPTRSKVAVAVTREITAPWRRGIGLTVRKSKGPQARAIGLWFRGRQPRILSDSPAEKDWQKVVKRSDQLGER